MKFPRSAWPLLDGKEEDRQRKRKKKGERNATRQEAMTIESPCSGLEGKAPHLGKRHLIYLIDSPDRSSIYEKKMEEMSVKVGFMKARKQASLAKREMDFAQPLSDPFPFIL